MSRRGMAEKWALRIYDYRASGEPVVAWCPQGILDRRFGRASSGPQLGELIEFISAIGSSAKQKAKDFPGEVYE